MQELTKPLTTTEVNELENLLTQLFISQGSSTAKEKILVFANQIREYDFPFAAVMEGIKSLMSSDVGVIKLHTVIESIRDKITETEKEKKGCTICGGVGTITMINERNYSLAFACKCGNGDRFVSPTGLNLDRWKGDIFQFIGNKKYILHDNHKISMGVK
jgi:hypothetical protein